MDGEVDPPDDLKVRLSWPGDDLSVTSRDPEPDDTTEIEKTAAATDIDGEAQGRGAPISGLQRRTPAAPAGRTASRSVEEPAAGTPIAGPTLPSLQESEPLLLGGLDALATALHNNNERLDGLTDSVVTLRSFVEERLADVGDAVSRSQTRITEALNEARNQTSAELEKTFARFQAQMLRQLDETLAEARARTSLEIEEAAQESQQSHNSLSASLAACLATSEEASRRSDRLATDIANLGDLMADALNQVADRLERLALTNSGQSDIVEVVAEALDDVAARLNDLDAADCSRHDRLVAAMIDLRSKRSQAPQVDLAPLSGTLDRIEIIVDALAAAGSEAAMTAVMTRLEARLADMALQREEHDLATQASLGAFEEMVSRLAVAQAVDLERILETVESNAPAAMEAVVSLSKLDSARLASIETELRLLAERPVAAGGAEADSAIGAQVAALSHQVEALRRRLAVRARPTPTAIDAGSLEVLAEMVAYRLRD